MWIAWEKGTSLHTAADLLREWTGFDLNYDIRFDDGSQYIGKVRTVTTGSNATARTEYFIMWGLVMIASSTSAAPDVNIETLYSIDVAKDERYEKLQNLLYKDVLWSPDDGMYYLRKVDVDPGIWIDQGGVEFYVIDMMSKNLEVIR